MHFTFIHLIWRNPSSSFIASNATVAVTRVHQEKKLSSLWSNTCVCNVLYTDSKGGVKYAEAKAETLGEIMQIVTDPSQSSPAQGQETLSLRDLGFVPQGKESGWTPDFPTCRMLPRRPISLLLHPESLIQELCDWKAGREWKSSI